jgi:hypothetical protein
MELKTLRLAIATAIVDGHDLEYLQDRLFREDPEEVRKAYEEIRENRLDINSTMAVRKAPNDRIKAPILVRNKNGKTISQIANDLQMNKATLVSLLEHHGYLELRPCGGQQSRYLVSDTAFHAERGHNVTPSNRIGHLEGFNRSAMFPVFYEDALEKILWTLDYQGIKDAVEALGAKKEKLRHLLENHGYLPDEEIAGIAGYTRVGVIKARNTRNALVISGQAA